MVGGRRRGSSSLVAVGRIAKVHGVRGELSVESLTDFPERFDPGSRLLLVTPEGRVRETAVLSRREHKGRYLLLLEGIGDRTDAEGIRGSYLKVREQDLKPLPEGQHYRFQLLDLDVVTEEGEPLGRVAEVFETGSNLVLTVRDGDREVLLPYIDEVILRVDPEEGTITVHLLEGLLPGE